MLDALFYDLDMRDVIKELEKEMSNNIATVDEVFVRMLPIYEAKVAERELKGGGL